MVRKVLSEVLTFDWRFKRMREKARRIPGGGAILDRVNSNFKSLEIDIFKDQQRRPVYLQYIERRKYEEKV